jgi:hypothetical protein
MVAVAGMAVLGMTATLAGAQTDPATYTLNDVMQAPFASDMLAAPTGAAVAWVFNAKGCAGGRPLFQRSRRERQTARGNYR